MDQHDQDTYQQGFEEGFASGIEGHPHPDFDYETAGLFEAGCSTGYDQGTFWLKCFNMGEELGSSGFKWDEEDLEMYVDLFREAFMEGRGYLPERTREQTLERVQARGCTAGDKQGEIRANAEQYDTVAHKQHDWVPNVSEKVMYPLSREEYVAKYQECYQNNFDSWLGIGAFAEGAPIWDCALGGYKPQDEQA